VHLGRYVGLNRLFSICLLLILAIGSDCRKRIWSGKFHPAFPAAEFERYAVSK